MGAEGAAKLILGIGNPGAKYEKTRHNVGFRALDEFARQIGETPSKERFEAQYAQGVVDGRTVVLLKPQTYVNRTGRSAAAWLRYYKAPVENLLVIVDDTNLPVGRLRVRGSGSAGGHNGLKSLIQELGSDAFARVRIGVGGKRHPSQD